MATLQIRLTWNMCAATCRTHCFVHDMSTRHLGLDQIRLTLGSSPYGPDAPRPYRRALCAP
jgi:hypothetical protein